MTRRGVGGALFSSGAGGTVGYGGIGWQGGSRLEQVQHYKTITYLAVRSICNRIAALEPVVGHVHAKGRPQTFAERRYADHVCEKSLGSLRPHEEFTPAGDDHPLVRLLRKPNAWDTAGELWYELEMFLDLTGNGYFWAPPSEYGRRTGLLTPAELWVVPSHWVRPYFGGKGVERYDIYPLAGMARPFTLPPEEVIHLKWKSPLSKVDGWSPQQAGSEWVDAGESVNRSRFAQFKNFAAPFGAVELSEQYHDPTDEQLERVYSKFFARLQGEHNYGKPLILPPGAKYTPLSIAPAEMAYVESLAQLIEMTLALWGVPKEICGLQPVGSDLSWYAPMKQFNENCLAPRLRYLSQSLTRWLCPRYSDDLRLWWEPPMADDPEKLNRDLALAAAHGQVSSAEFRASQGRAPFTPEEEAKYSQLGKDSQGGAGTGAGGMSAGPGSAVAGGSPAAMAGTRPNDFSRSMRKTFREEDHPRDDDGKFGSGGGGGEKKPEGQKRAKAGGEEGPNGEWYPGGAFIATTDLPKKVRQKLDRMASGKVSAEPGAPWVVPEPGQMALLDKLGGTVMNPRNGEVNYEYLAYQKYTPDEIAMYEELAKKWVDGERWVSINDYPALATPPDVVRLIAAGEPVPGVVMDRMPKELQPYFEKYRPKKSLVSHVRKSTFREEDHPRDDDGKFGSGGGGASSGGPSSGDTFPDGTAEAGADQASESKRSPLKRESKAERQARHDAEDAALEDARAAEDAAWEDALAELDTLEVEQEQTWEDEDTRVETQREQEDESLQRSRDAEDAAGDEVEVTRERHDEELASRREAEDEATEEARDAEDEAVKNERDAEDSQREAVFDEERERCKAERDRRQEHDEQFARETEELNAAWEKEDAERNAELLRRQQKIDIRQEAGEIDEAESERLYGEAAGWEEAEIAKDEANREKIESRRETAWLKEEARREKEDAREERFDEKWDAEQEKIDSRREAEDEKVQAKRDAEDAKRDARREKEDEKLSADREKEDARREKDVARREKTREKEDKDIASRREREDSQVEASRDEARAAMEARREAIETAQTAAADQRHDDDIDRERAREGEWEQYYEEDAEDILAGMRERFGDNPPPEAIESVNEGLYRYEDSPWEIAHDPAAGGWLRRRREKEKAIRPELRRAMKSTRFEESKHPRADDGKFGSGSGSAKPSTNGTTTKPKGRLGRVGAALKKYVAGPALAAIKKAGHKAAHIEHVVQQFVTEGIPDRIDAIKSDKLRVAVSGAWWLTKLGTKAAFLTYTAGQDMAAQVARAAGASSEQTSRLAKICTAIDLAGAKAVPMTLGAVGLGPVGAAIGSMIPIGSAAYLAYSTARRPVAVIRAAVSVIGGMLKRGKPDPASQFWAGEGSKAAGGCRAEVAELFKALVAHEDDADGFDALLFAALDQSKSLREALALAERASKQGEPGEEKSAQWVIVKGRWEESKHPRADDGKFGRGSGGAKKPTAKKPAGKAPKKAEKTSVQAVAAHVAAMRGKGTTAEGLAQLGEALPKLTVKELGELKKLIGVKASGVKAELVAKIKERALTAAKKPAKQEQLTPDSHPSLKAWGSALVVHEGALNDPATQGHLRDLARLPEKLASALRGKRIGVEMGKGGVADVPGWELLRQQQPRGWPKGKTWADPAGAYVSAHKAVVIGSKPHGSASAALHETGHAIGHVFGLDDSPELIAIHKEAYSKLPPYLQQEGPGGRAGRQEMLAEGFAQVMTDEKKAQAMYGEKFVGWIKGAVAKIGA